ncbi:YncE family protein, partial [Pyxidicoccus fallax]
FHPLLKSGGGWVLLGFLLLAGAGAWLGLSRSTPPATASSLRAVHAGVAVELTVEPVEPSRRGQPPLAGEEVSFRVKVTDAATGAPYPRVYPAAWVDARRPGERTDGKACPEKVSSFLSGGLLGAGAQDLNLYQVLVLNKDATLSVVDPRFGFGGSRLLGLVSLRSPGADWVLTGDDSKLFVSMPDSDRVAVVDPVTHRVSSELELAPRPSRLALQPDEGYLWVLGEGTADEPSVTVVSVASLSVVARLRMGAGAHQIAFSDDSRFAFITNREPGTVSVVDVRTLKVVKELSTGRAPGSVAFSRGARAAYVAHADGTIAVVDAERPQVLARITAEEGLGQLAFEKTGRYGFVLNPERDTVQIIDSATNRIIQSGRLERGPDEISFTEGLAYVRHRGHETVLMIPLDQVGTEGRPIAVVDFPGGQLAPGAAALAPAIVPAPGAAAVLVANAADKVIYYYKEGMAAPMGSFSAYDREPRAVRVLDRSLRERSAGVYETTARLRGPGVHDVAVLIDSPRVIHCFPLHVADNPALAKEEREGVAVEPLLPDTVQAGQTARLRFRLKDKATQAPRAEVGEVTVLAYQAAGNWHTRKVARPEADGTYGVDLVPPRPGVYFLALEAPSLGMKLDAAQDLTLIAEGGTP